MEILGIDIGGTGIKGALVDANTGELRSERIRHKTPGVATPENVFEVVAQLRDDFSWKGPVGCGFPGIIKEGVVHSAANLDDSWIGVSLSERLTKLFGQPAQCLNDADAAGLAEIAYGAGKGYSGVMLMITVGTGLGTALFLDGKLVPNTEFGHLLIVPQAGMAPVNAEKWASGIARKRDELKWSQWAKRFNSVLKAYSFYFSPNRFIIGGGIVKKYDKFADELDVQGEVVPAVMGNMAGIIGAAASVK